MDTPTMKHRLPPLPYALMALEPHMDAPTLALHHDLHHEGYVNTLNRVLESGPDFLRDKSAEWLLLNLSQVPDGIRESVRNNAGGHVNHSMLWRAMAPRAGGAPTGPLAEHIDFSFGSFEKFKVQFEEAGSRHFGSGWVWLVKTPWEDKKLQVLTTAGHDNPMAQGYQPILVNDVWEHAYYLKHQNRRAEYLHAWWPLVNWKEAERRFAQAGQTIEAND